MTNNFNNLAPEPVKIAVLVSGGVDSTIALHLLKEQGYDVTAFYLKVWMEGDAYFGDCPWQEDVDYVQKISDQLAVPFEIVALQREYWDRIIEYTLREVKEGRTPNPDMMCNKLFKFGAFVEKFGKAFDFIASGHYARIIRDDQDQAHLFTSMDPKKDQTYFLSQMSREQLQRCLFPVGDLTKSRVRSLAAELQLANAQRPDSQGICFLGKVNYREFISRHVGRETGRIIEQSTGKILGEHEGFWFYTIGQRFGLRLSGGPWFVVDKDGQENIIYVAHGYDPEQMYCDRINVTAFNWINPLTDPAQRQATAADVAGDGSSPDGKPLFVKIRHAPEFVRCRVQQQGPAEMTIWPENKIAGVAKGQFAVLYQKQECLGGGVIC